MNLIMTWLPTQLCDQAYPLKNVVLIKVGETGFFETDLEISKESIIQNNLDSGYTERDRIRHDHFAVMGYELSESNLDKLDPKITGGK